MPAFRDPRSAEEEARERRIAIARALVGAPALPQPLPKFGLTLLDVDPVGEAIDLVLGHDQPLVRARLEAPRRGAGEPFGIEVSIRETQPAAARHRAATTVIRERLARAITPERWQEARAHTSSLRKIPVGVPLSHYRQLVEGVDPPMGLVRTGFGCNQDCGFCWQSRDWPGYGPDQLRAWIEDLHAMGARSLTISGGEPTLDRALIDHVRHAKALGIEQIVIETNAIQMGKKPEYARQLREAGLWRAFVSLHSGDAEASDAATRAPGTHLRTVAGIRALLEAGIHVILNAVITRDTAASLPGLPEFVRGTFGKHGMLGGISISVPVLPFDHELTPKIVADPEVVRASLAATIDAAERSEVLLFGLDGPCGPPLCAFAADRRVTSLEPRGPVSFRVYVEECGRCAVRGSCHGVQPDEYRRYGARAVRPLPSP